jgi:hypothetical protein
MSVNGSLVFRKEELRLVRLLHTSYNYPRGGRGSWLLTVCTEYCNVEKALGLWLLALAEENKSLVQRRVQNQTQDKVPRLLVQLLP